MRRLNNSMVIMCLGCPPCRVSRSFPTAMPFAVWTTQPIASRRLQSVGGQGVVGGANPQNPLRFFRIEGMRRSVSDSCSGTAMGSDPSWCSNGVCDPCGPVVNVSGLPGDAPLSAVHTLYECAASRSDPSRRERGREAILRKVEHHKYMMSKLADIYCFIF